MSVTVLLRFPFNVFLAKLILTTEVQIEDVTVPRAKTVVFLIKKLWLLLATN